MTKRLSPLLLLCILHCSCIVSCGEEAEEADVSALEEVWVEFAPGVTHRNQLAFVLRNQPKSMLCNEIHVDSPGKEPEEEAQRIWSAGTTKDSLYVQGVSCPNPLEWGQGLDAGWFVYQTARPLFENRLYRLKIGIQIKKSAIKSDARVVGMDFCILQGGGLVSSPTGEPRPELIACFTEGVEAPKARLQEAPEEEEEE